MAGDPGVPTAGLSAGELVADAAARLADAASPTPRLDAELLVSHAFDRDRTWLHAHPEAPLPGDAAKRLDAWVARRAGGEPVAYIRGFKEWFGLRVLTDPRALIPRPETELLAEAAIAEVASRLARDERIVVAWDVGTGSGALALALALRFRTALALGRVRLIASDVSPDALELTAENLTAHRVAGLVTLAISDLLQTAGARTPGEMDGGLPLPDVVMANLPYVTTKVVDAAPGSLAFEPSVAVRGGDDGLDLIRRLVAQLPGHLAPGGVALLEVGSGQAPAVSEMARSQVPGAAVTSTPDLAGIERLVRVTRLDG